MNHIDAAIEACHIGLNAGILWLAWHYLWRRACQERLRQELFELRDDLFDYARKGEISFTSSSYILLRSSINSMIRFSHLVSVTRTFTFVCLQRYIAPPQGYHKTKFDDALALENETVRTELKGFLEKKRIHTFHYLLLASPHLLLIGPLLAILSSLIAKRQVPMSPDRGVATVADRPGEKTIKILEAQAQLAFRSEAVKRKQEHEAMAAYL